MNTELPQPLVVEVRDAQANVVPNVAVTWVIGSGGGSVTPADRQHRWRGRATAIWTLGDAPGYNTVSAVVGISVVGVVVQRQCHGGRAGPALATDAAFGHVR